jgi:hypothetical protein
MDTHAEQNNRSVPRYYCGPNIWAGGCSLIFFLVEYLLLYFHELKKKIYNHINDLWFGEKPLRWKKHRDKEKKTYKNQNEKTLNEG